VVGGGPEGVAWVGWKAGGWRPVAGFGAEGVKEPLATCWIYAWNRASSSGVRLNDMILVEKKIIVKSE
jgi:hypothetical protein